MVIELGKNAHAGKVAESEFNEAAADWQSKREACFATAWQIVNEQPQTEAGLAAMRWIIASGQSNRKEYPLSLERLIEHHVRSTAINDAIAALAHYLPSPEQQAFEPAMKLLRAVGDTNPSPTVRGHALLGLAYEAHRRFNVAEFKGSSDSAALRSEAEGAYVLLIRDYGQCEYLRKVGAKSPAKTRRRRSR